MRKRTTFAEGRAQLARLERREAKAAARHFKSAAILLEAEVASLKSSIAALESSATARDTELLASKSQVLELKDYIAKRFADEVHALGAAHPLNQFQRAADEFESEGGNVGLSARLAAGGHQDGGASTHGGSSLESPDSGFGGAVLSGSPDGAGELTDEDDGDFQVGLARRRTSSAGPSRPPASASCRRRRPSSSSGARRQHPSSASALAVPASSGPELPSAAGLRQLLPSSASASALAVPASSGPEKPRGRSSWNSRSAQLDVAVPPVPHVAAAAMDPVVPAPASRKRKSASPPTDPDTDDADSSGDSGGSPAKKIRIRSGTWTEHEKACLIDVMVSHAAAVADGSRAAVYDTVLWELVERRLRAEHGVDRGAQACRMTWNRGLREFTGIDERRRPDPSRMATSLQKKAGGS